MRMLDWDVAVEIVAPHVVQIVTPDGSGTGFLVSADVGHGVCAIATAAHVIARAHWWLQPIRLRHKSSGQQVLLNDSDRAVMLNEAEDTACILFSRDASPLPEKALPLAPSGKSLKVGNEIGWLGFPSVSPEDMCFFTGRISAFRKARQDYLVDGVAINGVSGGPAFWNGGERVTIMGMVSAYAINRAIGEALPGLTILTNVERFQAISKAYSSVEEAKIRQTA